MSSLRTFEFPGNFILENNEVITGLKIAYHTYGRLNKTKNNLVWVCHALTANSDILEWWPGLFGVNDLFNPAEYFIVCANIIGSHYGTTGPLDTNPLTGYPYFHLFPDISIKDMVKAHRLLADYLGIGQVAVLIGGSLGGQQALEWAVQQPGRIEKLVVIATNAQHSPWGIAFNESQRLAIKADSTYFSMQPTGGSRGLRAARSIAMLSYRNYDTYCLSQQEENAERPKEYKAAGYQRYQGSKLVSRFNAYSYVALSHAMDSHNLGRGHTSVTAALKRITAGTLVVGIKSDLLFPIGEQKFLASKIDGAIYKEIDSTYGHDGFLMETPSLSAVISTFLSSGQVKYQAGYSHSYNYFNV